MLVEPLGWEIELILAAYQMDIEGGPTNSGPKNSLARDGVDHGGFSSGRETR